MGVEWDFVFEPRPDPAPPPPSDEEVRRYYERHVPPGGPPLEAIREHVAAALLAARAPDGDRAPDPIRALADQFPAKLFAHARGDLDWIAAQLGVPGFADFLAAHPDRWYDTADGLRTVDALARWLRAELSGETRTRKPTGRGVYLPVHRHADFWRDVVEALDNARRRLEIARDTGRRFRTDIFT
jgi:hypothetical protein